MLRGQTWAAGRGCQNRDWARLLNESRTIQLVTADLPRMQAKGKHQGGMPINTMGDGMVMIFPNAIQAVRFSLGMQNAFNRSGGPDGLRHRFGLHMAARL